MALAHLLLKIGQQGLELFETLVRIGSEEPPERNVK
jgi:hypothetical protein